MTERTLIVSFTTYPARMRCALLVIDSLLDQDAEDYKVVVVISKEEFKTIPYEFLKYGKRIEIIHHPRNIRSHKKLIPVIKKYPNNPILVVDDDIARERTFVRNFQNDHLRHPNDIIGGTFLHKFADDTPNIGWASNFSKNGTLDIPLLFAKPSNGFGGTLYPPHTFTDPRFFDEDYLMRVCPTSDETWQFTFAILEDRNYRQSSFVPEYMDVKIKNSQEDEHSLCKTNKYKEILEGIMKEFPELPKKLEERRNRILLCIQTSGNLGKAFLDSILNQTEKPSLIVCCVPDGNNISEPLKNLVDKGEIALIESKEGCVASMRRHKGMCHVILGGNERIGKDFFKEMHEAYVCAPDVVVAREKNEDGALFLKGIIFPPDILDIDRVEFNKSYKSTIVDALNKREIKTVLYDKSRLRSCGV